MPSICESQLTWELRLALAFELMISLALIISLELIISEALETAAVAVEGAIHSQHSPTCCHLRTCLHVLRSSPPSPSGLAQPRSPAPAPSTHAASSPIHTPSRSQVTSGCVGGTEGRAGRALSSV